MNNKLENLIEFIKFLEKFRQVKRTLYLPNSQEMENDIEHSYQLAMTAWFIINEQGLNFDLEKIFKYCLAHDLVEIYSGDTFVFSQDESLRASKKEREHVSLERIHEEFPFLYESIKEYELRENEESKFVYALDKLMPCLNCHLDDGRTRKEFGATYEMWEDRKESKIASHPEVKKYLDILKPLIKDQFSKS